MQRAKSTSLSALLDTPSELTDGGASKSAVVLMTRVRLARNLSGHSFPGWAKPAEREQALQPCREAVAAASAMRRCFSFNIADLGELERQILVERHLISRELSSAKSGAGVVISREPLSLEPRLMFIAQRCFGLSVPDAARLIHPAVGIVVQLAIAAGCSQCILRRVLALVEGPQLAVAA